MLAWRGSHIIRRFQLSVGSHRIRRFGGQRLCGRRSLERHRADRWLHELLNNTIVHLMYRAAACQGNHPYDPTVGLCLGPYGVPRGVGVSYERGTPVGWNRSHC